MRLKEIDPYKYTWCKINNPVRVEIEKTIRDILTELVLDINEKEVLYEYYTNWTYNDPFIFIFEKGLNSGLGFDINLVQPFADQINSYLNSEGFKTSVEYDTIHIGLNISVVGIKISFNDISSISTYFKF